MALWTPALITTAAWWDASNAGSLTLNGSYVEGWSDLSGNGHNATASGTNRPVLNTAAVNGLNTLTFGNPKEMTISNLTLACDSTQFAIFTRPAGTAQTCILGRESGTYYPMTLGWASSTNYVFSGLGLDSVLCGTLSATGTLLLASYHKTDYKQAIYVNGTIVGSEKNGYSCSQLSGTYFSRIGRTAANSSYAHVGDIAEIVVVNATPNTTDRQLIEGYLANKWGINSSLPSDHPYYSSPPTVPDPAMTFTFRPLQQSRAEQIALKGL